MLGPEIPFLERWWQETRDPSPRQRAWKQRHALAGVLAYEQVGLLSPEQAARWRQRLTDPGDEAIDAGAELGVGARAAAERYLGHLIEGLKPLSRNPDPEAIRGHAEANAAIETLLAVGILDLEERGSWQQASWRKKAPWRSEPFLPPAGAIGFAIHVPPENDEQAAQDAARAAEFAARPKATTIERLIFGGPQRQDDLAIVALVVHEDATSLHFHFLGEREGHERRPRRRLDSFRRVNKRLVPPVLRDDQGQTYKPVLDRPLSSSGAGGIPDPDRREAITGQWQYTPPAPPSAREFSVQRDSVIWTLRDQP
jgi:hypothetical protein